MLEAARNGCAVVLCETGEGVEGSSLNLTTGAIGCGLTNGQSVNLQQRTKVKVRWDPGEGV